MPEEKGRKIGAEKWHAYHKAAGTPRPLSNARDYFLAPIFLPILESEDYWNLGTVAAKLICSESKTILILLLVATRIAATTWANVVQKRRLTSKTHFPLPLFITVWGWMTLLTIPWWLSSFSAGPVFWSWLFLACLLEVPGNVLLLRSLGQTELSIYGPLSSFKPIFSLLLAFAMFGEQPGTWGIVGVVVILIGTVWLTSQPRPLSTEDATVPKVTGDNHSIANPTALRSSGIRDRLLAVVLTATASVFLKEAMTGATQWQVLATWCLLSWLLALVWQSALTWRTWFRSHAVLSMAQIARRGRDPRRMAERGTLFMVAVAMLIMQGCTIALFALMPVGYALALFQIGSLVNVFLGHRIFGEPHLLRRLLAAFLMAVGACLILFSRG